MKELGKFKCFIALFLSKIVSNNIVKSALLYQGDKIVSTVTDDYGAKEDVIVSMCK